MKKLLTMLSLGTVLVTGCATREEPGTYLSPYSALSHPTTNNFAITNLPPIATEKDKPRLTVINHLEDPAFKWQEGYGPPKSRFKASLPYLETPKIYDSDDPDAPVPL